MKKIILISIVIFIIGKSEAQSYSINFDYTSKFIGKTVDFSINYLKNKNVFSAGFVFYTNQKIRETYDADTGFPLSPVHFAPLKSAAYGKDVFERIGFQANYIQFLNENEIVKPFIFTGLVVSDIGFRSFSYIPNTYFEISKMFVFDFFLGAGLKIKLFDNIYLNQSVSPGILFVNKQRISYFSSSISLNPMYKIGLCYRFGK